MKIRRWSAESIYYGIISIPEYHCIKTGELSELEFGWLNGKTDFCRGGIRFNPIASNDEFSLMSDTLAITVGT